MNNSPQSFLPYRTVILKYPCEEPDDINLYWKGRVAIFALFRPINIQEGDEIIIPTFTCVIAPNTTIYLGARPIYMDITIDTYNLDATNIEEKITEKKCIICQNTYGLSVM